MLQNYKRHFKPSATAADVLEFDTVSRAGAR
jgi:hypothetical protein